MAGDLTLKLKLVADEKAATAALKAAQRETQLLSREAKTASSRATAMGRAYQTSAGQGVAALQKMQQGMSNLRTQMLAFVAAGSAFELGGNIIQQADAYKQLESRLRLVTDSEEQLQAVRAQLMAQAQENRTEIAAVTQLYAGVTPVLKEMGKSQENILTISDSVSKALQIGGATAQQTSASILQLTQSLGSGVLRGDEFNSLMENAPALMQSLSDSIGLPVGSLRALADQGKLTSDLVANSLIAQNDALSASYEKIDITVGSAMVMVKNSLGEYIGETDKALGFTAALSAGLQALAADLSLAGTAAAALGAVGLARVVAASAASEKGMINQIRTRRAQAAAAVQAAAVEAQAEQELNQVKAQSAAQDVRAARRKEIAANQALRKAKAEHTEAKASLQVATANAATSQSAHVAAAASDRYTAALARLKVAQNASIQASGTMKAARAASSAATAQAAIVSTTAAAQVTTANKVMAAATGTAALAAKGLSAAMMLVGGPLGAALLATIAIYNYRQELIDVISYSDDAEDATDRHREAMEIAKTSAYEYATATEEVKEKLEAERDAALQAGDAQLQSAAAALEAAKIKLEAAKTRADYAKSTGAEDNPEGYAFTQTDVEEGAYKRAEAAYQAQKSRIEALRSEYGNFDKSVEELNDIYDKRDKGDAGAADGINEETKALQTLLKNQGEQLRAYLSGKGKKSAAANSEKSELEKLEEAQDAELAALKSTYSQLTLNEQQYYKNTLTLKNFAPEIIAEAEALKYRNSLLAAEQSLDADERGLSRKITTTYEADLRDKGLSEPDVQALATRKIAIEFEASYLDLHEQQSQLTLTDEMFRRATLAAQGYDDEQVDMLVTQQNVNTVLGHQRELLNEEIALRPKITAQYEIDLLEKGVEQRVITKLANEKIRLSFEAVKQQLAATNDEMELGEVVYRRNTLAAQGYNETQIEEIERLQQKKQALTAIRSVEESLISEEVKLSSKLTAELEFELSEAGVDPAKIKELADRKLSASFKALTAELDDNNQQINLNATAYRRATLAAQGYDDEQIEIIQRKEISNVYTEEVKALDDTSDQLNLTAQAYSTAKLEAKGYNDEQIRTIQNKELTNVFNAEMKALKESTEALKQNAQQKYEAELRAKGLTGELLKQVAAQRYANALEAERGELARGSQPAPSKAVQYQKSYLDDGFTLDDASDLAADKIRNDFKAMQATLEDNRNQILMTADAYRELGLQMDQGFNSKQASVIVGLENQNKQFAAWKGVANNALDSVGDNLLNLAINGEADWGGMIKSMIAEAFKLAVIQPMIESLKNSFSGMFAAMGGGGGIGGLLGSILPFANGGAFTASGLKAYAVGGAFDQGIEYFAAGGSFTNKVVNTPTLFGMGGGGLGVMGEAGPEAIMPLSRMGSGNLGVEVSLSGMPPMPVNLAPNILIQTQQANPIDQLQGSVFRAGDIIINLVEDASKAGQVERSSDTDGRQMLDVFVANIRQGGKASKVIESTYGLRRRGLV